MARPGDPAVHSADNIPLAVGTIVFTVFALSLGDALIKSASGAFVLWQIFVLRSAIAIPVLLAIIAAFASGALSLPRTPGWTSLRSLMLVLMWVLYYAALPHLQLSVAAAAYYTSPLFITLFSAAFAGERIGRKEWLAIGLGFLGVLLILRPRAGDFNAYALLPLVSAMLYAGSMILTRTKCRAEHPLVLSLALNVAFVVVGGLVSQAISGMAGPDRAGFMLAEWGPLGRDEWLALGVMAAAIIIGSAGAAIAYQKGPSSMVGTFDFAYVGFAVMWGAIFFADLPDLISLIGMATIVVAGVLSVRR